MTTTPRGVRSVSERILKNGRALIVTSEDFDEYEFAALPDGSLHVDPETGVISVKLKGETTWAPSTVVFDKVEYDEQGKIINVQNPTLVIARDTQYNEEKYVVGEIDTANSTFIYYRDSKEDNKKRQKPYDPLKGFTFELEDGEVFQGRNHVMVFVNNQQIYTVGSGVVEEVSNKRIRLNTGLSKDDVVCIRYIKWARIGNPYPRIFLCQNEPENAQVGDFWFDRNASLGNAEEAEEDNEEGQNRLIFTALKFYTEEGKWELVYNDFLSNVDSILETVQESVIDQLNMLLTQHNTDIKNITDKIDKNKSDITNINNLLTNNPIISNVGYSTTSQMFQYKLLGSDETYEFNIPTGGSGAVSDKSAIQLYTFTASDWTKDTATGYFVMTKDIDSGKKLINVWRQDGSKDCLISINSERISDTQLKFYSLKSFAGYILTSHTGDMINSITSSTTNNNRTLTLTWTYTDGSKGTGTITVPLANANTAGVSKLYTDSNSNATDGTLTAKAIQDVIIAKVEAALSNAQVSFDIAGQQYLGGGSKAGITMVATRPGLICAGGSKKGSSLNVKVDGVTLGYVVGRDYGTGTISTTVPVAAGQTVEITGYCSWAYFVPYA